MDPVSKNTMNHSNNDTTGIVWKLGQRSGNYQLTSDKSVSTEHSMIRIATTNPTYLNTSNSSSSGRSQQQQQPDATTVSSSSMDRTPMMASTPQMIKACNEAIDKVCVVVENVGKLGTFVIHEYYDEDDNDTNNNNKNQMKQPLKDDDDSETEDEMDMVVKTQTNYGSTNSSSNYQRGSSLLSSQIPNQHTSSTSMTNSSQNHHHPLATNGGIIPLSPITEYLIQQSDIG